MRFLRRTAINVEIVPLDISGDALGGSIGGFSGTRIHARGSIGFVANALNSSANALISGEYGSRTAQTIKLRLERDVPVNVGDGVKLPDEESVCWRCVEVNRYPNITVTRLERIANAAD